jgi:hypothetical protein
MRVRATCVLFALIASSLLSNAPAGADPDPPPPSLGGCVWSATPTMLGGTARYEAGEWMFNDFVYDDYGADTSPGGANQIVSLGATAGDFRYPSDPRYANNTADIAEVRLRRDGDDLCLRVTMNTLVDASTLVVGVAISASENPATHPFPFGAGVSAPADVFLTVADGSVRITDPATNATFDAGALNVDLDANTIEVRLPDGFPASSEFGLNIVSGLWDAAAGAWKAGAPGRPTAVAYGTVAPTTARVFDTAFNDRDLEPRAGNWMEDAQSDLIAAGDVTAATARIDAERLASGATDGAITAPGFYNRNFLSRMTHLAEGVNPGGFPQFNGLYQPYGLWIPDGYDPSEPNPLVLALHSLSVHHNQYAGHGATDSYRTIYEQLGDGLDAVMITPLARGPDGWYWDEGLVDTLEVWADVRTHYAIDDDRTSSTGYSMGGYGTYRLTTMMPDRFAAAVSWVGPPVDGIWAYPAAPTSGEGSPDNTYDQLESVAHIPTMIVHGTNDELVPVTGVTHQAMRYGELGHEYRYALHPGIDHFALVFLDQWSRERAWLDGRERVTDPGRVAFDVRPASWASPGDADVIRGHLEDLGAELDSAYWVRDIAVAEGDDVTGVVDLTTGGRTGQRFTAEPIQGVEAGPPTPYVLTGNSKVPAPDVVTGNALSGHLTDVTELTIDADRAGLSLDEPMAINVSSNRPATIHLRSGDTVVTIEVGA